MRPPVSWLIVVVFCAGCAAEQAPLLPRYPVAAPVPPTLPPAPKHTLDQTRTQQIAVGYKRTGDWPVIRDRGFLWLPYSDVADPVVTCAPLHVCLIDIARQELITDAHVGDSKRWLVSLGEAAKRPYVIVKPTESGLSTNLILLTTSGRSYHMRLVSRSGEYIRQLTFYFPADLRPLVNREEGTRAFPSSRFIRPHTTAVHAPRKDGR